jgi:hypothetical protein
VPHSQRAASWLPDHQLDVALTVAHADELTQRLSDILFDYLLIGPLAFETVPDGPVCHVRISRVAPLPAAVPRYVADVLTQLRAAVEHTIYAEVEYDLGRKLTLDEGRRIEMPVASTDDAFDNWLRQHKRSELGPLRSGSNLVSRMRSLQPLHRRDRENHPLRVLAEHTNLAKHRTPSVANVLLGRVNTWPLDDPEVIVAAASNRPLEVGTVLATGPLYKQVPLDIWPKVAIQRPHTGEWRVVMDEVNRLEEWVRTVALPVLITGMTDVPPLPPQVDITKGWDSPRDAIAVGGRSSASERHLVRIQAHTGRQNLAETLALHPDRAAPALLETWLASLSDTDVLARLDTLKVANERGPQAVSAWCLGLIEEAERFASTTQRDA